MFPRDSRTSEIAIAFLFCASGHCGKRMCWHWTVIIPLLCCLKCGQPAFFRFPVHVPRAAVFYFWMGCLCFCWWRWLIFMTPSDMPPLLQFTPIFFPSPSPIRPQFSPSFSLIGSISCEIGGILQAQSSCVLLTPELEPAALLTVENCFKEWAWAGGRGGAFQLLLLIKQATRAIKPL